MTKQELEAKRAADKATKAADAAASLHTIGVKLSGFASHSLRQALDLAADVRKHMKDYKVSVKGFLEQLAKEFPTANRQDLLETLAVGRAVAVASSFEVKTVDGQTRKLDLVAASASLTACRIIGRYSERLEKAKQGEALKMACIQAEQGSSIKAISATIRAALPPVERKAKEEEEEDAGQPDLMESVAFVRENLESLSDEALSGLSSALVAEVKRRKVAEVAPVSVAAAS